MKIKGTVFLTVLLFLAAGILPAQDIKFSGYFNSGLGVVTSSSNDVDTFLKMFGADSEQNGYRFRLNGQIDSKSAAAGIRFRFQSQSRMDQGGYFSLPYLYGWMSFFDNIVNVAVGIVDDTSWQTTDWYIVDDNGEGLGLMLKISPIKGLNTAIGAYLISQQASGSNNILSYSGGSLPNYGNIRPTVKDAKYTFSASYTIPDIFWFGATFRTKNKAGWNGTIDIDRYGHIYDGRQESSQLISEFRFLMLEQLTAIASFSIDRLEDFSASGNMIFTQTTAYKLNSLKLGLNTAEFFYKRESITGKKVSFDPGFAVNPWVSYTIKNIIPRLDIVYFHGGRSRLGGNENYMWHRRGFINRDVDEMDAVNKNDLFVFSVRPSAKINLTSGIFLEIGDMFNYDFANHDGVYMDTGDLTRRTRLSNVFYMDFCWSF